jgi:hypothetical protein
MSTPWAHDNAPVVVEHQSSNSTAADFLAGLAPFPTHSNAKLFEYSPRGRLSGFCVSEPRNHSALVLRNCNGSANQAWDAVPTSGSYEWVNEATGNVMTDGSHGSNNIGGPGTRITGQSGSAQANQLWDAVDS